MWWLRELRYNAAGRVLAGALIFVVVLGAFFASRQFFLSRETPVIETTAPDGVDIAGSVSLNMPATTGRRTCDEAKVRLTKVVSQSLQFANLDEAAAKTAFDAYAAGARTCSYEEFVAFERDTLNPWLNGQDMYFILEQTAKADQ
jgi:hypothetical protein